MDLNRGTVVKSIPEEVGGCDVKKKVNPEKKGGVVGCIETNSVESARNY